MSRPAPFLPLPGEEDTTPTAGPTQPQTNAPAAAVPTTTRPTINPPATTPQTQTTPTTGSSASPANSPSSGTGPTPSQTPSQSATSNPPGQTITPTPDPTATGGGILTKTTFSTYTNSDTPTSSPSSSSSGGSSFFQNKAAVAGIFSVVGLAGIILIIALISSAVRRRQKKKFDKETEDAATAAATAHVPTFLDDDNTDDAYPFPGGAGPGSLSYNRRRPSRPYNNNAGGGGSMSSHHGHVVAYPGNAHYSDMTSSHGTYAQPPMTNSSQSHHGHGQDMYGMREVNAPPPLPMVVPHPGELYNPFDAPPPLQPVGPGGNAGVGVARSRSTRDPSAFASGMTEGAAPYAAFAHPGYFGPQPSQTPPPFHHPQTPHAAYPGYMTHSPPPITPNLTPTGAIPQPQPGMSLDHNDFNPPPPRYPRRSSSGVYDSSGIRTKSRPSSLTPGMIPFMEDDVSRGEDSPQDPPPFTPSNSTGSDRERRRSDSPQGSPEENGGDDDEDEDEPFEERPRVLKIANE